MAHEFSEVNPLLETSSDPNDPIPLVELKQHLVIFVSDPPGPVSARMVYDLYLRYCGDVFKQYKSTFPGAFLREWTPAARRDFEQELLPSLRLRSDWGYGFSDGKPRDSWLFMFHGFRPFQQPNMASFYRFEFDWQVSPAFLRGLAERLIQHVPFLSAYGGFFLQGRQGSRHAVASCDRLFALAMRHWGCEVEDLEATAAQMKTGYKCVNWLTLIGKPFEHSFATNIRLAKSVAYDAVDGRYGTILQAAGRPILGDRNRLEPMNGYVAIARALLPMQINEHETFGGNRWTDENTMAWIRRFTDGYGVV